MIYQQSIRTSHHRSELSIITFSIDNPIEFVRFHHLRYRCLSSVALWRGPMFAAELVDGRDSVSSLLPFLEQI